MAATAGPQIDLAYTIVGPDGARAVFNDHTDPDFVGALTTLSGFDSPEIRESYEDITEFDGGVHGPFYYGRRPMTLEGLIYGHASPTERNERISKLKRATNAMRADATVTWTPDGAEPMFASVRRQQPLRIDGNWNKTFQIAVVAADPRFYSTTLYSQAVGALDLPGGASGFGFDAEFPLDFGEPVPPGQIYINQQGDTETFPIYTITGPGVNPTIFNHTTGTTIAFTQTLSASQGLLIDTLKRTVKLGTVVEPGVVDPNALTNLYSSLNFEETVWGGLIPETNDLRLSFSSGATSDATLRVEWRSAWL